jgi:hypothetical protein
LAESWAKLIRLFHVTPSNLGLQRRSGAKLEYPSQVLVQEIAYRLEKFSTTGRWGRLDELLSNYDTNRKIPNNINGFSTNHLYNEFLSALDELIDSYRKTEKNPRSLLHILVVSLLNLAIMDGLIPGDKLQQYLEFYRTLPPLEFSLESDPFYTPPAKVINPGRVPQTLAGKAAQGSAATPATPLLESTHENEVSYGPCCCSTV